jgi:hypothetical protein
LPPSRDENGKNDENGENGSDFLTNEPEQLFENKGLLEILVTNEPKNEPEISGGITARMLGVPNLMRS